MGIFDFFKKITNTEEVEKIIIEKLAFSEIENWIEQKTKENELKEKEILFLIKEKINNFIKELKEKILILENFDVESRKEKDDIKNIVINSREKYMESVEELIERLNHLEEFKLEKLIDKINRIFFDFNKSSFKNYERTTILIGKEMGSIKESLKVFSTNLLETYEENKSIIDFFKNHMTIKEKLDAINSLDKTLKEIDEKKSNLNEKISEKEKENVVLKQSLEEIKNSQNYLDFLASQKKSESLKSESKKYILELKQLINFKSLTNFFHINHEQMKLVKNHREYFQTNFERDNGKIIIDLLNESKLNNDLILEKLNLIRIKIKETENHEKNLKEDETKKVSSKIKEIGLEIETLKIESVKEEKRQEKLKTNKKELISSLKEEFSKMNIEII